MKFLVVLLFIVGAQAGVIKDEKTKEAKNETESCPGVIVNGVYHELEELKSNLDRPSQLVVDYGSNTLFFSYILNEADGTNWFKTASIDLISKEFSDVANVNNGFAQAIDQKNHEVYIGGSLGLYKYDSYTKSATLFGEKGTDIWSMYFKDVLYYTKTYLQVLYTYVNGESKVYKNLEHTKIEHFVIDNENVIFFTNLTGLFSQEKDAKDAVLYQKYPINGPRALATDVKGDVYVCVFHGIYKVNKGDISLTKILDLDNAYGLAFDGENNIIYSDATKLIRLKPNKEKACLR